MLNRVKRVKDEELKLIKFNLQLFASDEDSDGDDDLELDLDEDDDDFDLDPEDDDEDDEDDDVSHKEKESDENGDGDKTNKKGKTKETDAEPKTKVKDKITHALIKQKHLNRDLKAKLDLLEQKDREAEQHNRRKSLADKLVEKGYEEDEAFVEVDKQLENEAIRNTVKKLEFLTENSEIMAKYPQAKKDVNNLMKLQKSTGWSLEKICRVEYAVTENAFDTKVKSDQESRIKQKKRPSSTPAGGQTTTQSVKLESEDEKAYKFYIKKNPGVNRKQYADNVLSHANQKIPHDKWD